MKKQLITFALGTTLLGTLVTSEALAAEKFHSWNKPLNPTMANAKEMAAYEQDVKSYVDQINKEIAALMKLKHAAIHEYNLTAKEYNSDDFFHKDKVPFFGQKKRQHQSSQWIHIQVDRDNDWTKDWDDFDDEDDQFIINMPKYQRR